MHRFNPLHPTEGAKEPADVRFLDLHIEPWEDNRRIRVHMRLTPFQKPPNLEAVLFDSEGDEVASVTIIENIDFDLVFTLHIRRANTVGPFQLTGKILYEEVGTVDEKSVKFKFSL